MSKINIGVLGAADIAKRLMIPAIQSLGEFNLVAIASRDQKTATALSKEYNCKAMGYEELISAQNIDAIYIPLPIGLHYEWALKALSTKHVICEKTLTTNFNDTNHLIQIAQKNDKVLFENFMFLFHNQIAFLKDMIPKIGGVKYMKSSFCIPHLNSNNIRYSKHLGGGALLDLGTYPIRAAEYFLGDNLSIENAIIKNNSYDVDIEGIIQLRSSDNTLAHIHYGLGYHYQNKIEFLGEKGRILSERAFTAGPNVKVKIIIETNDNNRVEHILEADNHFENILKAFHKAICGKNTSYMSNDMLNHAKNLAEVMKYATK